MAVLPYEPKVRRHSRPPEAVPVLTLGSASLREARVMRRLQLILTVELIAAAILLCWDCL
jgi:hypothetical protein